MSNASVELAIDRYREQIDAIDKEIVALLNKRAIQSLSIRALKSCKQIELYDSGREEEIFEHLAKRNKGPYTDENLRAIYELILKLNKELP